MRRVIGLFVVSLLFLGGAVLLPARLQSHPFCEQDSCRLYESNRGEYRGECYHNDGLMTNCMMTGELCSWEYCNPE